MAIRERFLIGNFDLEDESWLTWWWWLVNFWSLYRAFQAIQSGECFAVLFGPDGVDCLSEEEFFAENDQLSRDTGMDKEDEKWVEDFVKEIQGIQAEKLNKQRQPKPN